MRDVVAEFRRGYETKRDVRSLSSSAKRTSVRAHKALSRRRDSVLV